jgi:hypothetical protein
MNAWINNGNTVTKAEAKDKIMALANEQGLSGAFKVFYDGNIVSDPNDLPESVDMDKVRVSAVLDQAKQ